MKKKNSIKIIYILLLLTFFGCNKSSHEKVIIEYDDGSRLEKWVINDSIDDGPSIKYYPSGNINAIFIAKNDSLIGKLLLYYENGSIKTIAEMNQAIVNGFCYDFYSNGKFKEMSFYDYGELIYSKKFNEKGNIIKQIGYRPVDISKIAKDCEFKPLTWKEFIPKKKDHLVFIKWKGCPQDALKVSINGGEIEPTSQKGIYSIKTNDSDTFSIISIEVFDVKRHRSYKNGFGFDVK
jgi:hypothetical protein